MPGAVLLLTLGIAIAALLEARRASISDHDTTRSLVRGHGAFAAWTFRRVAEERLAASFQRMLDTGGDGVFFRVPLNGGRAAWQGGLPPGMDAEIERAVREDARRFRAEWRFAVVQTRGAGLAVYTLREDAGGRVAHGFSLNPALYGPLFHRIAAREPLLPASLSGGRANDRLLLVQVLAPDGRVLFATPGEPWQAGATEAMGPEFGGMRIHASILQEAAHDLILGGRAPSRLPLLAGLLALAFVTGAVAMALLRRDRELARVRSDFVASVSHELRTPLAQIRLFLETLRLGRYRTDEQREWILDNIERESFRLAALVDSILHFSRAERGAAVGSREPVALAPYLSALAGEFAPLAGSRKARIETAIDPGLHALLHADSFRQVMLNLLDNAIKYGPAGQTVRVEASARGDRVRIAVEDEGPGVDPAERDSIWEPFRRGESAIGGASAGSGIGLAVVREIVEWHEGTARVEPAPGGGARFVVELPRAEPAPGEPRQVG